MYVLLYSLLYCAKHLHQHIQRNHPESHLSPEPEGPPASNDTLDPAAAAVYMNQDIDGSTKASVSQAELGPIVLQLSYSVGHCTLHLSTFGINDRVLSCLGVHRG